MKKRLIFLILIASRADSSLAPLFRTRADDRDSTSFWSSIRKLI